MTKCKEELATKGRELEKAIGESSAKLSAEIDPRGFRDYQARLDVRHRGRHIGHIQLAYSPRRTVYTSNLAAIRDASVISALGKICAASGCRLAGSAGQPQQARPDPQNKPTTKNALIEQAETAARFLLEALDDSGIPSEFAGVYEHYARLNLLVNRDGRPARLDIYNTAKYRLDLRIATPLDDVEIEARIGELWQPIRERLLGAPSGDSPPQSADVAIRRATVYHETLLKYAKCDFDFIDLAMALEEVARRRGLDFPEADHVRYDFAELERRYKAMAANPG